MPELANETCDECGFVLDDYTNLDIIGTLRAVAPMFATMVEGIDESTLRERPAPDVWSAIEYAAHVRDVIGVVGLLSTMAAESDHPVIDEEPPADTGDPNVPDSMNKAIEQVEKNVTALVGPAAKWSEVEWGRLLTFGSTTGDQRYHLGHAAHDATHHLKDVGRGLHALGVGAPSQRGSVAQINTSNGGVPKSSVANAEIDRQGIVGDQQANRIHHGRPLQALCLWSTEVIASLAAEGHPISAGLAGENLTLSGVDWSTIRPGVRLLVGDASIEISAWATPCKKNAPWFVDGDFNRMSHDHHPGWSRAYAWVREGGTVHTGDAVIVEP